MSRYYRLVNRAGEEASFVIRPGKPGDEKGIIECIRDEYGDTYFKQDFYDEGYLRKEAEEGHILFFVAEVVKGEDRGKIAGLMILREFYPAESMCEVASQIFKKKYRGYGLSMLFFEYGMNVLEKRRYSSALCLPVLFHDVTQRLMKRFGLAATGLIMNVFDVDGIIHSYDNGRNTKHSQGIQVKKVGKKDVGTLYLPKEHIRFCKRIYKSLGVKYKIARPKKELPDSYPGFITFAQNEKQHSLEIRIYMAGQDLADQVERVIENYPLKGKQTANVFLNINDRRAVWAYEQLRAKGWFFTGLRPLCGEREYMVLHNSGETRFYFEDYRMSGEFKKMTDYISKKRDVKKKKSIRKKITMLLVLSVLTVLLVTSLLAIMNLRTMKIVFGKQSQEFGETAAEKAELAMEHMAGGHLLNTSVEKAAFIEEKLNRIVSDVNGIVQVAERIYSKPDTYPDREVPIPAADSNELAVQLLWSERLVRTETDGPSMPEPTSEEQEELNKLANIQDLLLQYNANNDMISSVYIATETGWMIQADYIAYSKYSQGNVLPDYYEASERQWYAKAMDSEPGEVIYSDVIADVHKGADCIVCARAVYLDGEAVAVVGIGSYLEVIHEAVLATTIGDSGYAFLVNEEGQIMVSGAREGETSASSENLMDLRNSSNQQLAEAATDMAAGGSDLIRLTLDGREVYLAYAPIENPGWSFVTVMDAEEVIAPAIESQNMILALTDSVSHQVDVSIRQTLISFVLAALLFFVLIGMLEVSVGKRISEPIQRLAKEVAATDGGNLDSVIVLNTGDEVEELANAFKTYSANLERVTAEKERIQTELSVAARIQSDMLPDSDSMLHTNEAFSLYAAAYPAKEVGGDFYDFFPVDEDHLVFLVADVSGKGVPAALFMVMAKALIENQLMLGKTPAEAFESVNDALCRNNRNGMFLTAWMGVLELSSGNLEYVNAGHNCPLWYSAENHKYTWLTEVSGFVLAGMEGMTYEQKNMKLGKGDKIFVYSDGVPEANDENEQMFGNDALESFLTKRTELSPNVLCEQLKQMLNSFQGKAEQFDDITMLALEYMGGADRNIWSGTPDEKMQLHIEKALTYYLSSSGIDKTDLHNIMVAFDEIYSNIRYYSGASAATVRCDITETEIAVIFEDDGVPFNPLESEDPDINEKTEERAAGGLGIFIVRKLMDEVLYERNQDRNVLSIKAEKKKRQSTT